MCGCLWMPRFKMNWGTISAKSQGFCENKIQWYIFPDPNGGRIIATKEGQEGQDICRPTFGEWQRLDLSESWWPSSGAGSTEKLHGNSLRTPLHQSNSTDTQFQPIVPLGRSTIGMPIMYYVRSSYLRTSRDSRPAKESVEENALLKTLEDGDLLRTDRVSSSRVVGHANRRMSSAKRSRRWLSRGPTPQFDIDQSRGARPIRPVPSPSHPEKKVEQGKFSGD